MNNEYSCQQQGGWEQQNDLLEREARLEYEKDVCRRIQAQQLQIVAAMNKGFNEIFREGGA